ncbi:hypothetical protein ACTFIU_000239 [Dictyostelium citrinum]
MYSLSLSATTKSITGGNRFTNLDASNLEDCTTFEINLAYDKGKYYLQQTSSTIILEDINEIQEMLYSMLHIYFRVILPMSPNIKITPQQPPIIGSTNHCLLINGKNNNNGKEVVKGNDLSNNVVTTPTINKKDNKRKLENNNNNKESSCEKKTKTMASLSSKQQTYRFVYGYDMTSSAIVMTGSAIVMTGSAMVMASSTMVMTGSLINMTMSIMVVAISVMTITNHWHFIYKENLLFKK